MKTVVKICIALIVVAAIIVSGVIVYEKVSIPFLGFTSRSRVVEQLESVVGRLEEERAADRAELELSRSRIADHEAKDKRDEERQRRDAGYIKQLEGIVARAERRTRELEEAAKRAEGSVGTAREATLGIGEIATELEKEFERFEKECGD